MNWNEAHTLMETAQDEMRGKPIANNTRLYKHGFDAYVIKLHGNVIMIIYSDRNEIFDGDWKTSTTKERLNRYIPRGFRVYQKDWRWYLKDSNNDVDYRFDDVRWIHNDGRVMLHSTHPNYPNQKNSENLPFLNWNNLPWGEIK